jgi:hypothetical protein
VKNLSCLYRFFPFPKRPLFPGASRIFQPAETPHRKEAAAWARLNDESFSSKETFLLHKKRLFFFPFFYKIRYNGVQGQAFSAMLFIFGVQKFLKGRFNPWYRSPVKETSCSRPFPWPRGP